MSTFSDVLVVATPGDLDLIAARRALSWVSDTGATVTLFDVVAPLHSWERSVNLEGRVVDLEAVLTAERRDLLEDLGTKVADLAEASVDVATGKLPVEIVRRVLREGHDLVMLGESPVTRMTPWVKQVLRLSPVPVWVVRPAADEAPKVMALVDLDPSDPDHHGLDSHIVELASDIARRNDGELHLGHAWDFDAESSLRQSPFITVPSREVDALRASVEEDRRTQLQKLASSVGTDHAAAHLVRGHPQVVLPRLAAQYGIDVIVMGTVGRTGLAGWLMGNTAEAILDEVFCHVLAVKPDDFESPITLED